MPEASSPDVLKGPLRTYAASTRSHYRPRKRYLGPLTLVLADDPRLDQSANRSAHRSIVEDWKKFAPYLVSIHAPGNHLTMLKKPHARSLADLLFANVAHEIGETAYA